ncbi:MAG: hypothetical protein P4K80_03170 [Acidobacteriaceae bacterium]|nr:hypothetical protein [Acidobacteriaceae bacterium]
MHTDQALIFSALLFVFASLSSAAQTQSSSALSSKAPLRSAASENDVLNELAGTSEISAEAESLSALSAPPPRGITVSFNTGSQHDSSNGWTTLLTPYVAYRFNPHFSVDSSVPLYLRINVDANVGTKSKPVYAYASKNGTFGDTSISLHGDWSMPLVSYTATGSMGVPSGNSKFGLGAGQLTYSVNNHFEREIGRFTPDLELGFGDTSQLVNLTLVKSYITVGPMAHFQVGTSIDLPLRMSFDAEAFEELPLDNNLVYSTTGSGKKKVTTSTNIDPAEDNGFIVSLEVPITHTFTISSYYNRSLRDHDDLAGFSFNFLLTAPKPKTLPAL